MITLPGVSPNMIANNLTPFEPTHPGELIKDEIEYRKISQKDLAERIGIKPSFLNEVIKGKRAVNTEFALLVEAALDIPAEMLLNLQSDYNMQVVKSDASFMKRLSSIRNVAAFL
ncbi:MAG: HigA family addiction module antidote protein [Muribaculaceae bacterium]|nr:HigA family addiction module antidote protein [Muribaculaceae bacterium]